MRKVILIFSTLLVAACAASGDSRERDRAANAAVYERHAGAAQSWVRYTSIRNWWAVGHHSVVFEMDRSRHYLVELIGACDLELDSAITLRLASSRRNVLSEMDDVVVRGRACQIQSIRRLDYEAVESQLGADPEKQGSINIEADGQSSGGT